MSDNNPTRTDFLMFCRNASNNFPKTFLFTIFHWFLPLYLVFFTVDTLLLFREQTRRIRRSVPPGCKKGVKFVIINVIDCPVTNAKYDDEKKLCLEKILHGKISLDFASNLITVFKVSVWNALYELVWQTLYTIARGIVTSSRVEE